MIWLSSWRVVSHGFQQLPPQAVHDEKPLPECARSTLISGLYVHAAHTQTIPVSGITTDLCTLDLRCSNA